MQRRLIAATCLAFLAASPAFAALPFGKDEQDNRRIEVVIEGVGGDLEDNVRALSSLNRLSTSKEIDDQMVGRLVKRAPDEAAAALRPFGFYEPKITTELEKVGDGWRVTIRIKRGKPVILVEQKVEVAGPGRDEPFMQAALGRSTLRTGKRLDHQAYDQLKGELQRAALGRGYLDATFTRADLLVDLATHEARAFITLETGERYRFGATTIEQNTLRENLVKRYLRWDEGDWYDAEAILRTQFALDDSQYFSLVEVLPGERDRTQRTVPMRITSEPNRRHVYTISAGYGSDTGPRGTIGWEDRRLNRSGHRVRAQIRASEIETSAGVAYIIPWTDPALEKLSLELRGFTEQHADVETTGTTFTVGLTQVRGNWQRVLSVTVDKTRDEVKSATGSSTEVDENRSTLLVPGITYAKLPPNFLGVNAVPRGFQTELLASTETLGSDTNFARLTIKDERLFPLNDKWGIYLRGQVGTSAVGDFEELPADYRFFAGGDQSVRGYGYQELSPLDAQGNKVGGRHLLTATFEVQRVFKGSWVAAVFADGGNAINDFDDPLEYSVGIGLRYRLPFLSIGLDVAQSISEPDRSPRLHLNFTPEF
jgi:translocation and assembly module TamA